MRLCRPEHCLHRSLPRLLCDKLDLRGRIAQAWCVEIGVLLAESSTAHGKANPTALYEDRLSQRFLWDLPLPGRFH